MEERLKEADDPRFIAAKTRFETEMAKKLEAQRGIVAGGGEAQDDQEGVLDIDPDMLGAPLPSVPDLSLPGVPSPSTPDLRLPVDGSGRILGPRDDDGRGDGFGGDDGDDDMLNLIEAGMSKEIAKQ